MKILFLHGWHSTPGGVKPTFLRDHGHEVLNPVLPDDDFGFAVRIAQSEFHQHQPDVVVGSSRGGAVAMNIKVGDTPLVLLCPAWKRWGTATKVKFGTVILHSMGDDVVPFEDSVKLVRRSGLPESALIVVGHEHRLADPESLAKMLEAVESVFALKPQLKMMLEAAGKGFYLGISGLAHEAGVPSPVWHRHPLVITTMYAVLFAVLRTFQTPPLAFLMISLFFTAVGLGQMVLFQRESAKNSIGVVGACFWWCLMLVGLVLDEIGSGFSIPVLRSLGLVCWMLVGPLLGYVAGLFIAAVFLMIHKLGHRRGGSKSTDQAEGQ